MSGSKRRRRQARATTAEPDAHRPSWRLALLLLTFSGTAGLIYEVVWSRQLILIFGATSHAITTTLAAFMLGLALGSLGAGRWAQSLGNPFRAYACLEFGIGIYGLAFPLVLALLDLVHVPLFRLLIDAPIALGAARVVLATAALLPPTALMGASLPVLSRILCGDATATARDAGALYALNTLGAAAGVYLTTFLLIPHVGLLGGSLVAAALNGIAGGIAWARRGRWQPFRPTREEVSRSLSPRSWVLVAYACAGFASLGYEVIWTRILVLLFGSSVYAFAVMLASFLLGLGLGSLAGGQLVARAKDPFIGAASLQVVIVVGVLAGAPWFDRLPLLFLEAFRLSGGDWWTLTTLEFLLAFALMIVPTAPMGATFPFITRLSGGALPERVVGDAYAANTWGAILGAAVTGFALIPWFGFRGSLVALAGLNILAACQILWVAPSRTRYRWALPLSAGIALVGVTLLPDWNAKALSSGVYLYPEHYGRDGFSRLVDRQRLLFYREGTTATVAVMEGRFRFLRINGKTDGGDSPDHLTQRLLAHIPLLLHAEPRSVLVVGLGTGVTLGTALLHPVQHVDAVEISPEVVEASRFFVEANGRALDDPRSRLRILDARTWLRGTATRYDAVISEPSNPWQTGNASLFTIEHYRATRARLNRGGIFCQWLPYYRMAPADFKAAVRTFRAVFPETTIWFSGNDVLLVGAVDPLSLEARTFLARVGAEAIARSLKEIGIADGAALLAFFMLDAERAREFAGDGPPFHTDNYPLLEFSAPKTLYTELAAEIIADLRRLAAKSAVPVGPTAGWELRLALYEGIAQQQLTMKMPEAALSSLARAASIGGTSARLTRLQSSAWNDIGVTLGRQGQSQQAITAFERALSLAPNSADIHVNLGLLAFHGFNDLARAEHHLRAALGLHPNHVAAHVNLANLWARQGRWVEAEERWRQVLQLDPSNANARRGLEAASRQRGPIRN